MRRKENHAVPFTLVRVLGSKTSVTTDVPAVVPSDRMRFVGVRSPPSPELLSRRRKKRFRFTSVRFSGNDRLELAMGTVVVPEPFVRLPNSFPWDTVIGDEIKLAVRDRQAIGIGIGKRDVDVLQQ